MKVDWLFVVVVALSAIGFIQWLKGLLKQLPPNPGTKMVPDWVWAIALPVVIVGLAGLAEIVSSWILLAFLALAIAQIGYENIIKLVQRHIDDI